MKHMKTATAIILTGLLCLICLAGCSNSTNDVGFVSSIADRAAGSDKNDYADSWDNWADDDWDMDFLEEESSMEWVLRSMTTVGSSEIAGASVANSDGSNGRHEQHERKVIRNARLSVRTTIEQDVLEVYARLVAFTNSIGGHEFSGEINNSERRTNVDTVLKIPPEKLDDFIEYVGTLTTITHSMIESDDVTSEFYDLTTRLETKRRSLESYYNLLEHAESVEEIIHIQRTIDGITEEIESAEGRLRVLSNLVSMATATLWIYQEDDPEAARREVEFGALSADDMWYHIKSGFTGVVNFIAGFFQWLIIVLVVTSPLWIPLAAVIVIIIWRIKSKKKKRQIPDIPDVIESGKDNSDE